MVALTLIAVVVAIFHPIAWTDEEMRFAVDRAGGARRRSSSSGRWRSAGSTPSSSSGRFALTPLRMALAARRSASLAVLRACSRSAGGCGFGPLAAPPGPDDPASAARAAGAAARRAGCGPAGCLGLPVVWAAACLVVAAARRLRRLVHPVGDGREPPDRHRLAARPHRPDAARPDRPDVPLPQRPDDAAPGVVAVVGLAARPQARLVLPGGPRRPAPRPRSTTPATSSSGGWASRRWPSSRHGVQAPQPGPGADRGRLRRPVDPVGPHRPRRVPVPLLHGAAVRGRSRSPTSSPSSGTGRRAGPGCSPASAGAAAIMLPGRDVAVLAAAVRRSSASNRSIPGSQACPAVIPDSRPDRAHGAASRSSARRRPASSSSARSSRSADDATATRPGPAPAYRSLVLTGAGGRARARGRRPCCPTRAILTLTSIPVEPIVARRRPSRSPTSRCGSSARRDPRRFVVGFVVAVVGWFVVLYPNIAALPAARRDRERLPGHPADLPVRVPVPGQRRSTATRRSPLLTPMLGVLLLAALVVTCLVVAYSPGSGGSSLADRGVGDARPTTPTASPGPAAPEGSAPGSPPAACRPAASRRMTKP